MLLLLAADTNSTFYPVSTVLYWRFAGRQIAYNTSDYTSSEHQSAVVTQPEPLEGSNSFPQLPAVLAETDGAVAGEGEAEEEPTPVVEPPKPRVPQRTALDGVYWGFEILLQHLSVSGKDATSAAASGSEGEQAGDKATGAESMADAGGDFAAAADADHTVPAAASDECAHETASVASGDFTATSCCDHTSAHDVALRAQSVPVEWICSSDEDITELDVEVIYDECAQEKVMAVYIWSVVSRCWPRSNAPSVRLNLLPFTFLSFA